MAVVVEGFAGVEEHVGDAGDGDEGLAGVLALREDGAADAEGAFADVGHGAVAEAVAAAGETDLAEHGRQGEAHPGGLLAVVGALQRPGDGDQGARVRHPAGEGADGLGGDLGDGCGPLGGLGDAVGRGRGGSARSVSKPVVVASQERGIVEVFGDEGVGEGEHDGDVGAGDGAGASGRRASSGRSSRMRAEEVEGDAAGGEGAEVVADGVAGDAAGGDVGVLHGHAAEADDQLGVLGDDGPGGGVAEHVAHAADDAVEDDLARRVGVGVAGVDVAAERVQEAVELALGVVEAAGAGPAVGAAEDRLGAVVGVDAVEFGGEELGGGLPIDGDERVGAAVV